MTKPDEIVQQARSHGIHANLFSGLDSVRTVVEASQAVDRELEEVANTVLVTVRGDPILVLVPGNRRVHGGLIGQAYGADTLEVSLGTRQEIREHTGHEVGMIPPFGLNETLDLLVDEHLLDHESVLVPSGSPDALIEVDPDDLASLSNARVGEWSAPLGDGDEDG